MAKESSQQWLTAIAVLVVACLVGLVAPHYVPETPGSPGTIVAMLFLWFLGGSLGVVGIALTAKAVVSKRR
jgi:hypothetical protein